jgi:hypothetical protein
MSRRLLVYSNSQIFWVCAESSDKDRGNDKFRNYDSAEALRRSWLSTTTPLAKNDIARFSEEWRSLLEEYALRKLSDSSDKLPAFSSIPAYFATKLNDDYVAGLWRRQFPNLLCWRVVATSQPENWRAPSWGYTMVNGSTSASLNSDSKIWSLFTIPMRSKASGTLAERANTSTNLCSTLLREKGCFLGSQEPKYKQYTGTFVYFMLSDLAESEPRARRRVGNGGVRRAASATSSIRGASWTMYVLKGGHKLFIWPLRISC